ncbi:MAG: pirin [bacterium]|nr:pirin [bacterium]
MAGCEAATGRRSAKARFLEQALAIEAEDARSAGELGFMARIFVQATLPHSRPKCHEFERVNGRYSLHLAAPPSVGLPYGSYPRLVLAWLTTEAVRTKSPEIRLGPTFSDFMYRLGLTPVTGKRGTVPRLRDQLHRLFSTTLRWTYTDRDHGRASGRGYVIAGEHHLWWSHRDPAQQPLWRSKVVLGHEFFEEATRSAVPVDRRALRLLKRSPLALDIYVWLTYRMSYLKRPCLIPWEALRGQFGAAYARPTDFRQRFLRSLRLVLDVYPRARISQTGQGLWLISSPSHVTRSGRPGQASPVSQ